MFYAQYYCVQFLKPDKKDATEAGFTLYHMEVPNDIFTFMYVPIGTKLKCILSAKKKSKHWYMKVYQLYDYCLLSKWNANFKVGEKVIIIHFSCTDLVKSN